MSCSLSGVVNSLPMFFHEDGKPDLGSLERYLELLKDEGEPRLIYPMAYNTRVAYLRIEDLIALHCLIRDFCAPYGIQWAVVPPYKASTRDLHLFFEKVQIDQGTYGASILFPERYYGLDDSFFDYFSVPNAFGMKTLVHEMKLVSGIDGSLIDWPAEVLEKLVERCDVVGIKEDSKNDELSETALAIEGIDVVLAGGGVTQLDRLVKYNPQSWLAGVSLIEPALTKHENRVLENDELRMQFMNKIEVPFFELCKTYGWHRVHKSLLHSVHNFPRIEPGPMSMVSTAEMKLINERWTDKIEPEIQNFSDSLSNL
ncbi:hypothetical protein N8348_04230 [Litorivicinus sp.]|nr:hypothetical protein [Litorivicinus sp.]